MARPRFQFSLMAVFVLTTVVAVAAAMRDLAPLTPAILLSSWLLTGYLLARLLWPLANK
jgi:hypothetical protein